MNILVTGSAGFFGNFVTNHLLDQGHRVLGLDNLSRKGSSFNAEKQKLDTRMVFKICDISDNEQLLESCKGEKFDWIIDCAADPTVLAGLDGNTRKVIDNNLISTINLLEICKNQKSGFILMSTSRVYSIPELNSITIEETDTRFCTSIFNEIDEKFSTQGPISLYGSTKLTSEILAIEYSKMFDFPVWINRCGVIAGPGQFGKIDQGIISYWIYSWIRKTPLKYIGFGGTGKQVRDIVHPIDICRVMDLQIEDRTMEDNPIYNLGGGYENSISLQELTEWCIENIDPDTSHLETSKESRSFDIPIYITYHEKATKRWNFKITQSKNKIFESIRDYAINNPEFIELINS